MKKEQKSLEEFLMPEALHKYLDPVTLNGRVKFKKIHIPHLISRLLKSQEMPTVYGSRLTQEIKEYARALFEAAKHSPEAFEKRDIPGLLDGVIAWHSFGKPEAISGLCAGAMGMLAEKRKDLRDSIMESFSLGLQNKYSSGPCSSALIDLAGVRIPGLTKGYNHALAKRIPDIFLAVFQKSSNYHVIRVCSIGLESLSRDPRFSLRIVSAISIMPPSERRTTLLELIQKSMKRDNERAREGKAVFSDPRIAGRKIPGLMDLDGRRAFNPRTRIRQKAGFGRMVLKNG